MSDYCLGTVYCQRGGGNYSKEPIFPVAPRFCTCVRHWFFLCTCSLSLTVSVFSEHRLHGRNRGGISGSSGKVGCYL